MIGLDTDDENNLLVKSIGEFTSNCGIAFQLRDDILGVIGNEKVLGKPVGSDIKEGKKTTMVYYAMKNANRTQKKKLLNNLGNPNLSKTDIEETINLLKELGGIQQTHNLAVKIVDRSMKHLKAIPDSKSKKLLEEWAHYLIERDF